ncbi:putative P-loop ATPase (plasmid) [Euzebya pacifica]|uniref:Putative P-loop ATPase n=1 Tax=Euzebya pacifica TaxID=1608957 RepID=A0A346Y737_9ACTN|nr:AAA family ATPase [Euzebya pacifica]AXV10284.1 putative P-loop ATPase [Euzebya pacifica]
MSTITVVAGLPGTGKSTFARALADATGAAFLDRDTLMDPIVDAGLVAAGHTPGAHHTDTFLTTFNMPAYRAAENVARDIAIGGVDVVLVACYTRQAAEGRGWWDDLSGRMAAVGADTRLLWLDLDRDEHRRRLDRRNAPRDAERSGRSFNAWHARQNTTVPAYACRIRASLDTPTMVALATMTRVPLSPTG